MDAEETAVRLRRGGVFPSHDTGRLLHRDPAAILGAPRCRCREGRGSGAGSEGSLTKLPSPGPSATLTGLGHSSITVTLDRYGHLLPGDEDLAAFRLDVYLENAAAVV